MTRLVPAAVLLAAVAALAALPADAPGCGVAPRENERVSVSDESALIVWDEATKTEHFIRRARFEGTAYDFGFLVPTPTRPRLDEADETLFGDLSALTAPKTVYETHEVKEEIEFGCSKRAASDRAGAGLADGKAAPGGFEVLEQKRVGNLDYAILGFKPGAALAPEVSAADVLKWLNEHGYAVRPDLVAWIAIYARDNWVITAFKIAGVPPPGREVVGPPAPPREQPKGAARPSVVLSSTAVRMSFQAERPFFPYREPAGQRVDQTPDAHRHLRVFVAARQRMAGKLGDGSRPWPGRTVWADAIPEATLLGVHAKGKLPAATEPAAWRVTEFEDASSPRPGTDEVYFEPAADQSPVARPPHVKIQYKYVSVYPDWFGPVVVLVPFTALVAGILLVRRIRLRK